MKIIIKNEFDCADDFLNIDDKFFPEVTFENSPQLVKNNLKNK